MIKAVIIDDEVLFRNDIQNKINEKFSNDIEIVGEATTIKESIILIEKMKPNLLFLDIELKDGISFEIFNTIEYSKYQIIFITGFNEHAIKAIKVGALDYILKPIDTNEFNIAVSNAINKIEDGDLKNQLKVTNDYFKGIGNKKVVLKTQESTHILKEEDIYYCKSEGNYTTFYTSFNENILLTKSIKKVEEILSNDIFIKTHQSYIVNKNYVTKLTKHGFVILNLKIKIPVSVRRKEFVKKRIFDL